MDKKEILNVLGLNSRGKPYKRANLSAMNRYLADNGVASVPTTKQAYVAIDTILKRKKKVSKALNLSSRGIIRPYKNVSKFGVFIDMDELFRTLLTEEPTYDDVVNNQDIAFDSPFNQLNELYKLSRYLIQLKNTASKGLKNKIVRFKFMVSMVLEITEGEVEDNTDRKFKLHHAWSKMMNIEDNQQKLYFKLLKEYQKAIKDVASVPVPIHAITRINILRPVRSMTNDRIKKLTAFASDITDRKYHNATLTSTTKHRNCIYQTYYINNNFEDIKKWIYKKNREKFIKDELEKEPQDIQDAVKDGRLVDALILFAKKDNKPQYLRFFRDEAPPVLIQPNGDYMDITPAEIPNNTRVFLYYHNHVAPAVYVKNKDEKGEEDTIKKTYTLSQTSQKVRKYLKEDQFAEEFTLDYETYTHKSGFQRPYALCTNMYEFYGIDCTEQFIKYIDTNLVIKTDTSKTKSKTKVPKYRFWTFNGSRFDNFFLYMELLKRNPTCEMIIDNSSIKCIKYHNVYFHDFNLIYAGGLASVAKSFKISLSKTTFPYKFCVKQNLNYVGQVPSNEYWNNKYDKFHWIFSNQVLPQIINKNNICKFDMKEHTLKYCKRDCKVLLACVKQHLKESKGEITRADGSTRLFNTQGCPTGAGVALKCFKDVFLDEDIKPSNKATQLLERDAYKGGRTEVFVKKFTYDEITQKKCHYYDRNSSYPASMCEDVCANYVITLKDFENVDMIYQTEYHEGNSSGIVRHWLYQIEGVYENDDDALIPNILYRDEKTKRIISLKNVPLSCHWGVEILHAMKLGFKITRCDKVVVYEASPIFKEFAEYFYGERLKVKKTDPAKSAYYKLQLNSLYGKMATKDKNETIIITEDWRFEDFLNDEKVKILDFQLLGEDAVKLEITRDDYDCKIGSLVRLSSYITALARTDLAEVMLSCGHENIAYCDTDSVFTFQKPQEDMIDQSILGKWKSEIGSDFIINADWYAPKTYRYETSRGKKAVAGKGVKSNLLSFENMENINSDNGQKYDFSISTGDGMFQRSLEGIKIINSARIIKCVYNKRKWTGIKSSPYTDIEEWRHQNELDKQTCKEKYNKSTFTLNLS